MSYRFKRPIIMILAVSLSVVMLLFLVSCDVDKSLSSTADSGFTSSMFISSSDIDIDSNTSLESTSTDNNVYDDFIKQIDELEDVINGLDEYTSSDFEVPTP